jgi:hypothetical protein
LLTPPPPFAHPFFIVPSRSKFQKLIRETASTKGEREGKVITKKIKKKTNKKEIKKETEMKKEKLDNEGKMG